jgi:glycosyltransferase involved in cell wall biosynthesis
VSIKLSVIVACHNAAPTIGCQLDALAKQQWDEAWELLVSDNGSTDNSVAVVQKYADQLPFLRIVDSSGTRGAAHARNVAARFAKGEALAFCDADDEVAPGWVRAMGEALSTHDFVGCRIEFAKLNPPWVQSLFNGHPQTQNGFPRVWYPPHLEHAGAGTIGVRKRIHDAVGGFDESVLAQEDTDYCFRVLLRGTKLIFVPEAVLHVRCRSTLPQLAKQAFIWSENAVFLYKRYRIEASSESWRWKSFMRQCHALFWSLPEIRHERGRAGWTWRLAWQLGRLSGSLKHRVPPV